MSNRPAAKSACLLLLEWVVASLVGWVLGLVLGMVLTAGAARLGLNEDRAWLYATLLSLGLACGAVQGWVLRAVLPGPMRWVAASLTGYLLASLVIGVSNWARIATAGAILLILMGTAIAIPQWWVLRQAYRRTGVWVLATGAGFLSFLWLLSHPARPPVDLFVVAAILGALASLFPGVALVWLVRQPQDVGALAEE